LLNWDKRSNGTMKNLCRIHRNRAPLDQSLLASTLTGRDHQFDFVLGYLGASRMEIKVPEVTGWENKLIKSRTRSLAAGHELMVKVSPFMKWGPPQSKHMIYRSWEKLPKAFRKAITESKAKAYEDCMVYLPKPKGAANEEWQIDELSFKVKGINAETEKEESVTIYCVTCVDTSTGLLLHVEASLRPIDKVTFLRAIKRALLGNKEMGVNFHSRPTTIRMDGASIHEKNELKRNKNQMDLRRAGVALNIELIWNPPASPRMNPVIENFNGHFKDQFVLDFNLFIKVIAPALNSTEWLTHLKAFPEQLNAFGYHWNTTSQSDGTSRLQKHRDRLKPGTTDITADEIDRAVRYTMRFSYRKGVRWEEDIYDNPGLFHHHHGPWVVVRVRPEGPGPDMEAYVRNEHIGTLYRKADHTNMSNGMISSCKAYIDRHQALNEKRIERFADFARQLYREGALGTPAQQAIVRGKALSAEPIPPPTAETKPTEAVEMPNGWKGVKL
jgi:hypothetical protein